MAKTGSTEWLLDVLKNGQSHLADILKANELIKDDVSEIGVGKGMASNVYNHVLHLSNGEKHSVVVKIPGGYLEDEQVNGHGHADNTNTFAFRMHNREVDFFNAFPQLCEYLPTPLIYLAVPYNDPVGRDAVVVMDSLVGKANVSCITEGFNSHQVFNIAKDMAKFQSHFLVMEDQSWEEKFPMDVVSEEVDLEFFKAHFVKLGEFYDGRLKALVAELEPLLYDVKVWRYTTHSAYKHLKLPPVMCNDDTWVNNILWKFNADGSLSNEVAAYIDWQLAHAGCLTIDLVCVLAFCVKPSFQRQSQYKVLQCFYDTLKEEVAAKGGKVEFSFDQIKECYKANFIGIIARDLGMQTVAIEQVSADVDEWTMEARRAELATRAKLMLEQTAEFVKDLPKELLD